MSLFQYTFYGLLILATFHILLIYGIHLDRTKKIIQLDEKNWTTVLKGEWMLEFYAPWCPACNALQPVWEELAQDSDEYKISVGQVDITVSPGLSGRFMVTALPTIFHIVDGQFRQYKGSRNKHSLSLFITQLKWKEIDPLPSWKSPDSLQMSTIAYFFELSQFLRGIHAKLLEDYGLPTWGSYLLFAIVTIIIGAIIGLVVVSIIDLFYPPKYQASKTLSQKNTKSDHGENTDDEIATKDEIVDEANESGNEASLTTRKRKVRKAD